MTSQRQQWLGAAFFLLLLAVVAAAWFYQRQQSDETAIVFSNLQCDLSEGNCAITESALAARLTLQPQPVIVMEPMTITFASEQFEGDTVTVLFRGVGMDMGLNRFVLQRDANGSYRGQGVLPICVQDRMPWQVDVVGHSAEGKTVARFHLTTTKQGGG